MSSYFPTVRRLINAVLVPGSSSSQFLKREYQKIIKILIIFKYQIQIKKEKKLC